MTFYVLVVSLSLPACVWLGYWLRDTEARMTQSELQTALAVSEKRWQEHWDVCTWVPKVGDDTAEWLIPSPEARSLKSGLPDSSLVEEPWPDPPPPPEDGPSDALAQVATQRTWSVPVKPTQVEEAVPCPEPGRLPPTAATQALRGDFMALRHVAFGSTA